MRAGAWKPCPSPHPCLGTHLSRLGLTSCFWDSSPAFGRRSPQSDAKQHGEDDEGGDDDDEATDGESDEEPEMLFNAVPGVPLEVPDGSKFPILHADSEIIRVDKYNVKQNKNAAKNPLVAAQVTWRPLDGNEVTLSDVHVFRLDPIKLNEYAEARKDAILPHIKYDAVKKSNWWRVEHQSAGGGFKNGAQLLTTFKREAKKLEALQPPVDEPPSGPSSFDTFSKACVGHALHRHQKAKLINGLAKLHPAETSAQGKWPTAAFIVVNEVGVVCTCTISFACLIACNHIFVFDSSNSSCASPFSFADWGDVCHPSVRPMGRTDDQVH